MITSIHNTNTDIDTNTNTTSCMDVGPIALLCQKDTVHTQIPLYDTDNKRATIYNSSSSDSAKGYLLAGFEFTSSSSSSSSLSNIQDKSISLWKDILSKPDTFNIDTNDKYKPLHMMFGSISLPPTTVKDILEKKDTFQLRITDATNYYSNNNHSNYLVINGTTTYYYYYLLLLLILMLILRTSTN